MSETRRSLLFRVILFRITRHGAFTSCERSSYCSPSDKVAHPTGNPLAILLRKEAGFLATPAKIIRPPTQREAEDFNLYRNAKRGFKRANNAAFSPSDTPPLRTISILSHKLPMELHVAELPFVDTRNSVMTGN